MGIKILLADDSVTAQNIGKKILSEAGYEVVTVSNGAAAAKKIAELKPELVLLDVFMPGYSGLELCEKLRKAADTAKLPVLLTVGKLEPHSPQDVARVKADGVIIKPFEASDLTAAVERLAQKLKPAKPSVAEPEKVSHPAEFKDESYLAWKHDAPAGAEESTPAASAPKKPADAEYEKTMRLDPAQIAAMLKSPPETATPAPSAHLAPAAEFSVAAPAHSMEEFSIAPAESSSDPSPNSNLPAFDVAPVQAAPSEIPSYMSQYFSEGSATESAVPEAAPAPLEMVEASSTGESAANAFSKDSVVQHFEKPAVPQVEIAPAEGLELTAAAPVADVSIAKEAGLEPTLQTVEATTFVIQDPALVTDPHSATMDFTTQFGTGEPGLAEDLIQSMGSAAGEKVSTDDFEARLNAAMNAFAEPSAELPELMGANAGLPDAMVELPSLEAPADAEPVSLESPIEEARIEPEPLLEQLRAASLDPEIPKPGKPLATEVTSSIIESEMEVSHAVVEAGVNEAATEVSPVPDETVAASPAAEEPAAIDAIASAFIGQAYPKTAANSMHEASAPETDEAVIRQMREAFSELPVDHSHLVEHAEAGPAPMAMAAVAAAAPATVPSQIGHEAELEIARALSAAVGAESSFDSRSASAQVADNSASDDANKMATAVENVMRRELPNLIWKIMAELDLSKRS